MNMDLVYFVVGFGRKFLDFDDALLCAKKGKCEHVQAYYKDTLKWAGSFKLKTNKWELQLQ